MPPRRRSVKAAQKPIGPGATSSGVVVGDASAQAGEYLTTAHGVRVPDTDHSLKAGERGPTLMEDFHLREKITHFDHERIPERVVHARGAAAHGVFESYENAAGVTKAHFLGTKGRQTDVDVGLCEQVADGLGLSAPKGTPTRNPTTSAAFSQIVNAPDPIAGRTIGFFADATADLAGIDRLRAAASRQGATALRAWARATEL